MRDEPPAESNQNRSGVLFWLTCLAFAYPLFYASRLVIHALPGLIEAGVFGARINYFRVSWRRVIVITDAPSVVGLGPSPQGSSTVILAILLLLIMAGLTWLARGSHRPLAGLALAMLGQSGVEPLLWPIWHFQTANLESVLQFILYLSMLIVGLGWLLAGTTAQSTALRTGTLLASFSLPVGLIWGIFEFSFWFGHPLVRLLGALTPGAAGVLVASLLAKFRNVTRPREGTWKPLAAGSVLTLILPLGTRIGGQALNQHFMETRRAANRAALAFLPPMPLDAPYPKLFFQKGVNFTAEFPDTYDSEGARQMLAALPPFGINAIALVPYGWSSADPPMVRFNPEGSWENDEGLEVLSRVAHAHGIKVLLKPALWSALDIDLPSSQDRAHWFVQYELFLDHYARLARQIHVDLFCIGGEFSKLTLYDAEWRQLIARVRDLYPGPLVYAANFGSEFENMKFWDALDYIGLQEYYPLPDELSTSDLVRKIEAVQQRFRKPVIFTEVGFASLEETNRRPWDDTPRKISLELQARCYEAIFRAFYEKPWFEGMYWWKVETNGSGGSQDGSHSPWGKPAMNVLKGRYLERNR